MALAAALSGCHYTRVDVSNSESIEAGAELVLKQEGRVDFLVCNAGITRDQLMLRLKEPLWDDVLNVNLKGAYLCIRARLRPLLRAPAGAIVCMGSVVAEMGNVGQVNYAAAKAGLEGMARCLAKEVGGRGLRVNVLAPGFVATDMTAELSEEWSRKLLDRIPLGRIAEPSEIAEVAAFLLSHRASYITGQVIGVNGGLFP
jgi:3-oxoacyl-[acyl-carrier protein] reductase